MSVSTTFIGRQLICGFLIKSYVHSEGGVPGKEANAAY